MADGDLRIVLDLDDTLYPERDYVRSGFGAVGSYVAEHLGISNFGQYCWERFLAGERGHLFDSALTALGGSADRDTVDQLVHIYRTHRPRIHLYPDAERLLKRAALRGTYLGLITDGPATSQRAKIEALHLTRYFRSMLLTDELGLGKAKPHPASFELIQGALGPMGGLVYIADNPAKDFLTPNQLGWDTIRVLRPEGLYGKVTAPSSKHEARVTVSSLDGVKI